MSVILEQIIPAVLSQKSKQLPLNLHPIMSILL